MSKQKRKICIVTGSRAEYGLLHWLMKGIKKDSNLKLQVGFSHDIDYEIPKSVKIECPKPNIIKITSVNKELLGVVAAKIRAFRKPEPFKGRGIKYENELIFRKEGKKK